MPSETNNNKRDRRIFKKMVTIFFLILFLPLLCISQNRNDNLIVSKGIGFNQIVEILLDNGYNIDKIDSNYKTLKTEYKKLCSDCIPEIMLEVRVKDSIAFMKGKWRSNGGLIGNVLSGNNDYMYFDIMNEKQKVPKQCFSEMDKIAKLFSNDITYSKQ